MKISYQWLCELLPGLEKISATKIAERLTFSGLEVEGIEDLSHKYKGIVVGEVIQKEAHPKADKLSLCQVSSGDQVYQVVCGAKNVEAGKKFPFATLGTVMPAGLEIQPIQLRGIDSHGMLCSASELELSAENDGLMVLESDLKTGQSLAEALNLQDVIFDINITPNRGDALSHWGVARDVSALTGLKIDFSKTVPQDVPLSTASNFEKGNLKVQIHGEEACGRFSGSQIFGVAVKNSPQWLAARLESLGIRSINNVVDATNYVMLLTGHPVHAYDERDIKGGEIHVRTIQEATSFQTLDETKQKLQKGDLVICDQTEPVGLAGIMGGANSEIKPDTQNIILEVAYFNPDAIRKTSRRLGLQTDSAYRFARFVNPQTVVDAHQILRDLILSLAGGKATEIVDIQPQEFSTLTIKLPRLEITRILGIQVDDEAVLKILNGLGCQTSIQGDGYQVEPPVARSDLTRSIDLVEEVARLYGLEKIPATLPQMTVRCAQEGKGSQWDHRIKDYFVQKGFLETIHYSFGEQDFFEKVLRPESTEHWISLQNPISEDLKVMRPSLLPSLLQCYLKNRRQVDHGLRFFELRNVYRKTKNQIQERPVLAGLYSGNPWGRNRFDHHRSSDFFDGKGWLLDLFRMGRLKVSETVYENWPFHPGQSLSFQFEGQDIARLGALHPSLLQENKIKESVYYFEACYQTLSTHFQKAPQTFSAVSSLPAVYRDLALIAPLDLSYEKIQEIMKKEGPEELVRIQLFDLYQGDKLPAGKKSLGFSMVYQPASESLTDEQVNEMHFALVETLKTQLGVELRS